MKIHLKATFSVGLASLMLLGCSSQLKKRGSKTNASPTPVSRNASIPTAAASPIAYSTKIDYPDVDSPSSDSAAHTLAPRSVSDEGEGSEYYDLTLPEAIQTALTNSRVLKDLSGRIMTAPGSALSVYDPAIRQSHPTMGVAGALSAFDAQHSTGLFYTSNDRAINNITLGGGTRQLDQDLAEFRNTLSKQTASGTQFTMRNILLYDASNQPGNLFESSYEDLLEFEARVPLMRGAGTEVNRIAGPGAVPGLPANGVLLARVDEDISLTEFENGVRDFVSSVEDAYWELQFAYRDLNAKIDARDQALMTWQIVKARSEQEMNGGEAGKEAQAREQYFFYQNAVNNSLAGTRGGSQSVGVYLGERRLRRLLSLPANDGSLLRPSDSPLEIRVVYDWQHVLSEAVARRVEIRRQQWNVKRAELELVASKNLVKPQVDLVGLYRARGLGDQFTGSDDNTAWDDLISGDHQEFRVGVEYQGDIGRRRALAGVRHAQLKLARACAVLNEQQLQVSHDLSDAVAEVDRTYASIEINSNRFLAAKEHLDARRVEYEAGRITLDLLLRAQTQLSDSQTEYFRSQADYMLALKNANQQIGRLLENHQIFLSEGSWDSQAQRDAERNAERWQTRQPGLFHRGQQTLSHPTH
ncbi:MAG: TolC family protein [Rubripirellula sp.]